MSPKDVEVPFVSPDEPLDPTPDPKDKQARADEADEATDTTQEASSEGDGVSESTAEPSSLTDSNAELVKATSKQEPPSDQVIEDPEETRASTSPEVEAAAEVVATPSSKPGGSAVTVEPAGKSVAAESEEVGTLRRAMQDKSEIEGRVIGWNNGGFHVVVGATTAFCPKSEMELGAAKEPSEYLDETLGFQVLRVQKKGRRIVLSRAALLRGERARVRTEARDKLTAGSVVSGRVASLTDFGAFVDLGGVQGLVHVSEMSRQRIEHPSDLLEIGQEIEVKILKLEKGGRRISLSLRALEPDPWKEIHERFSEGSVVTGKVEKTTSFGAFIELEPGVTGLLPASVIALPRDASMARVYPPGKQVQVQIVSVDPRRQRISLTLEGSTLEGSRSDYQSYLRDQRKSEPDQGFNALADAFRRLDTEKE